jgi:Leucine Rich repeats (2 copies)
MPLCMCGLLDSHVRPALVSQHALPFCTACGTWQGLRVLCINNNRLDTLPAELTSLPTLEQLDVSGNDFSDGQLPLFS